MQEHIVQRSSSNHAAGCAAGAAKNYSKEQHVPGGP